MLEIKTVDKPDERRDFPRGHLEAVHMTGLDFAVGTFEPGWRWSESVAPSRGPRAAKSTTTAMSSRDGCTSAWTTAAKEK